MSESQSIDYYQGEYELKDDCVEESKLILDLIPNMIGTSLKSYFCKHFVGSVKESSDDIVKDWFIHRVKTIVWINESKDDRINQIRADQPGYLMISSSNIHYDEILNPIISSGNFGKVRIGIHESHHDQLLVIKEVEKLSDEMEGVKLSYLSQCKFLRPIGYMKDGNHHFCYMAGSLDKVSLNEFKWNLLTDLMKLKRVGLQHCDLHHGNITLEGNLIDAGLITKIGERPRYMNHKLKTSLINNVVDPNFDLRCLENQGGVAKMKEDVESGSGNDLIPRVRQFIRDRYPIIDPIEMRLNKLLVDRLKFE